MRLWNFSFPALFDAALDTRGGDSEDRPLVGGRDGPALARATTRSGGRAGMQSLSSSKLSLAEARRWTGICGPMEDMALL